MATATLLMTADVSAVQDLIAHFRAHQETIQAGQIDRMQELLDADRALIVFIDVNGVVHVEPSLPMIELMADVAGGAS